MLLKYSQYQKRSRLASNGQPQRPTGGMKMLNGKGKGYRKGMKCAASKRLAPRLIASKKEDISPMSVDPCDNSNDSGLGFDHLDFSTTRSAYIEQEYCWGNEDSSKKRRYDVKLESDNANDNFTFLQTRVNQQQPSEVPLCLRGKGGMGVGGKGGGKGAKVVVASSQGLSRDGKVQLQILSQPEMQHRARYQTEGSRGAVKDRTGNSFPIVKLTGYNQPATLEVYIGTDQGRVAPHMFYQACRVSGKNSTPCAEKKVDGTVIIEIDMDPTKDMTVTCDCVGILKERNVDVEHRFPEESSGRSKKKSTRCRIVFRTVITNDDGSLETLQVTSQPIICTQPPGVPEICKKSLSACPATGGLELFILGKNFLKDTRICFSEGEPGSDLYWESVVQPDKEFLQQSHLVCTVPPYRDEGIREMVAVRLSVRSSGRNSEPHTFFYTSANALPMDPSTASRASAQNVIANPVFPAQNVLLGVQWHVPIPPAPSFVQEEPPKSDDKVESEMMPPPSTVPPVRRSPTATGSEVKREAESPPCLAAALREFVSPDTTLPSLSVENYLSRIESPPQVTQPVVQVQKQVPVSKTELISLPLPPLNLDSQQTLSALPSSSSVIMEPKIAGLLPEGTLLFPPPQNQVTPAAVTPELLEAPVAVQEFVPSQSTVPQAAAFDVGPLGAHTDPNMVYSSETLAVPTATSLPQPFAPLLSEPTTLTQFVSPAKSAENKTVKAEFHGNILPSLDQACQQKVPPLTQKKCEEGIPLPQELTQMSENDLLSYINPSCFDQGNTSTFSHFFL